MRPIPLAEDPQALCRPPSQDAMSRMPLTEAMPVHGLTRRVSRPCWSEQSGLPRRGPNTPIDTQNGPGHEPRVLAKNRIDPAMSLGEAYRTFLRAPLIPPGITCDEI